MGGIRRSWGSKLNTHEVFLWTLRLDEQLPSPKDESCSQPLMLETKWTQSEILCRIEENLKDMGTLPYLGLHLFMKQKVSFFLKRWIYFYLFLKQS